MDKVFEGTIVSWNLAGFGFVEYESGRKIDRVYFQEQDVKPSNIGLRSYAKTVGNTVRFRLKKYDLRGRPSVKAVNVESLTPVDVADPLAHREVSSVDRLTYYKLGVVGGAILRRTNGDELYLSADNVADQHKTRFQDIQVGQRVFHSVKPPQRGRGDRWCAVDAQFYSEQEEQIL